MRRRLLRLGIAIVTGLATSALILSLAYAVGLWLGRNTDNLWFLLRLTVPLGVLLGVVAAICPEPNETRISASPFVLAAIGIALGGGYWYLVGRTVGLGFLGIAVQTFACWTAAAVAALLLALGRRTLLVLIGVATTCLLAVVVPAPAFNYFAHNQALTVAFVVPEEMGDAAAYPKNVGFDSQAEVEKTANQVLQSIGASGVQGTYRVVHLSRGGEGKDSLAIIVIRAAVSGRTLLPQPNAAQVIYVQQPEGWTKVPVQAPTLRRCIEIWGRGEPDDSLAYFAIPDASGISLMGRIRRVEMKH